MKDKLAVCANVLLVILEIIGFILLFNFTGWDLRYYTIDSNLFVFIAAILFLIYLIQDKCAPKIVDLLKFSSTLSVLLTFLVVVFILYPTKSFDFNFLFLEGPNFFFHVACPIVAVITFALEKHGDISSFKDSLRALYFTIIYSIILIALNILRIVDGPYPFLRVYEQSVLASVLWIVVFMVATFLLSRLLLKINGFVRKLF